MGTAAHNLNGKRVIVLGAGMVGVCTAIDLLRRGAHVTLLDRKDPGRETSFGNAGVLARSSILPMNNPGMLWDLPALMAHRRSGLRYNMRYLFANLGWALPFVANARAGVFRRTVSALDALIQLSIQGHRDLVSQSGQEALLSEEGWLFLYRTSGAYARSGLLRQMLSQFDVRHETIDSAALQEIEPSLSPMFPKSIWVQDSASVSDPGGLVNGYAGLFAAEGGRIARGEVAHLSLGDHAPEVVLADGARLNTDHLAICLGPWGKEVLNAAGYHVPMAFERGYHRHFSGTQGGNGPVLNRPVYDTGGAYVLSPMRQGLRLTSGVELNNRGAAPHLEQLEQAESAARQAIDLGTRCEEPTWLGARPTFPDSRPCIGALPGARATSVALGHQHIGFATGPGTAQVLGDLIEGKPAPIDAHAFRPERFIKRRPASA